MSKLQRLNALERRDLLASPKATNEDLRAHGRSYFDEEAYYEALQFFSRAADQEGLADCKRVGIETADHELLWQLDHCPHARVTEDEWRQCAQAAIRLGKLSVAAYVFRRLGDAEALDSLAQAQDPSDAPQS